MAVLAIDQGTSGTKAMVIEPGSGVRASAEAPVRPRYGRGGLVEQDPYELLDGVVEAGCQAVADARVSVEAIGLANQGETVLAWDKSTGRPLTTALVWQDRRARTVCARLSGHGPELAALTGLTLDPYFAAPKMTWIREHLTRDGVVTTSDVWLIRMLTGAFVTDAATASRTLLLDLDSVEWSATALDMFGLAAEDLPRIVNCAGPVGETSAFGGRPIPLTGLAVDQQAAMFAQGCLDEGAAKCTYGTGAFLLANLGRHARRSAAGLSASVAWRLGGETTYCLDGQVYAVGSAVRWLMDLGLLSGAADLDRLGLTVPDSGGVTMIPALAGMGAPWWRPHARGLIHGFSLETTPAHLIRALVDGVACQVAEVAAAVAADLGRPLAGLRADGGLTRSELFMQTQADLLQAPVEVYASPDATALGVGALAHLGATPGLEPANAAEAWTPAVTYQPQISQQHAAERLGQFRAIAAAVPDRAGTR